MRSHAKASSAGSNSGQSAGLGAARRPGALLALFLALFATACLLPGSALAAETRLPTESFGPDGTAGTSFEYPSTLAFDQGNKHLYALDQAPAKIYGFDTSTPGAHTPLGGNFPLSAEGSEPEWVDDLAVDSTSHNLYFLSERRAIFAEPALNGFDSGGAPLAGNFPFGGFEDACGTAVDPSGDIWVADAGARVIKEYDSSGNPIGSIGVSGHGGPCHVAFDSQANLYVSFYSRGTWRYNAAGGYATSVEIDPEKGTYPFNSNAIAVDRSSDDLYVTHSSHVSVYDSSGAFLYEFGNTVAGARYTGIAIDQGSDQIYVTDYGSGVLRVFGQVVQVPIVLTEDADGVTTTTATLHGTVNPDGNQLTDCHFEFVPAAQFNVDQYESLTPAQQAPCVPDAASIPVDSTGHAVKADISGLDPNTAYHFRIVAGTAEGDADGADRTLTTALGAPTVSAQTVDSVGTSDVNISAKIDPKGAKTTYHVEYGTTVAYGQSSTESLPIGFEGDNSAHTVSVHIGGLQPGTAYHFRFVATNSVGSSAGPDGSFATFPTSPGFAPCPNDQFRGGLGGRLPDCRAYEQATPVDKHGANVQGTINVIQASSAGDRVSFYLGGGLPESQGSSNLSAFIASRGPSGWSSASVLPATSPGLFVRVTGWSEDLTTTAVEAPGPGDVDRAIYLRDSDSGAFQLGPTFAKVAAATPLAGFAADTAHLIFESEADFLPGAVEGKVNLYDLDHGTLTLAGRIPAGAAVSCDDAGAPACVVAPEGSFAGPYAWASSVVAGDPTSGGATRGYYTQNTISRDGSRVFFTTPGGRLYLREDGAKTTLVSASQATVPDPNGEKPAAFMAATPDGSKVFFTSCEKLTDDSTALSTGENSCTTAIFGKAPSQGQDLYSYDTGSGELTDLTVDTNAGDPRGAAVKGVLGASDDGSYVYFTAAGVLAPGASPGNCEPLDGAEAACNLYVSHDGVTTFVAPLERTNDLLDWVPKKGEPKTSRVSADGSTLLFSSYLSLTGYDNTTPVNSTPVTNVCAGHRCPELFRYEAADDELTCVSCNPAGTPPGPDAGAALGTQRTFLHEEVESAFLTRNLSADGSRVFFDSGDALVPSDTNGVEDVYEWEAKGSGSCESESQNGGCLYLLSSGTSPDPSYFADASANGDHVFIFTSQQLVPSDHDQLVDVYDAGSGDGLASQHVLAPSTCASTACQSNPPPPVDPALSSASFTGPGNAHKPPAARKCPKGKRKVRRAGKVSCKKQSKHKQHKRHTNRGGSK